MSGEQDYVAEALDKLERWQDVVPPGSQLLHATKNTTAILNEGFRVPGPDLEVSPTFGHAGLAARGDLVSLTWSVDRAVRYLDAIRLLVLAARPSTTPEQVASRFIESRGLQWNQFSPVAPGDDGLGSFWFDAKLLTEEKIWDHLESDDASTKKLWKDRTTALGMTAWDALVLLDARVLSCLGADASAGAVDARREYFSEAEAPSLGILEVTVKPGAWADVRREEDEIQVQPSDITGVTLFSLR